MFTRASPAEAPAARSTSPAPIVTRRSPAFDVVDEKAHAVLHRGRPADEHPRPPFDKGVHDELPRHPLDRLLPGGIDIGHRDDVGGGQRVRKLAGEMPGAGVEMRLEQDEQAAVLSVTQRVQCRGDLGRMMSVVVVDGHASCIAAMFEPPRCATELCEYACGLLTAHTSELECRERGRRVAAVVLTGDRQWPLVRGELLSAHHRRDVREPAVEEPATSARDPNVA